MYYVIFGLLFYVFWFLFKVGGMQNVSLALLSTAIDVAVTIAALAVTVELLLPRLIYQQRIVLFFACFLAIVLFGGTVIILSQLRLLGSSLSKYPENIARYQKHYFYWFWADLVFGSYFMIFFIAATGAAVRLAFDRIRALNKVQELQKEKAMSELELLKRQINPHFLFNALNTIYYKIDRANGQARETLQLFSNMLRYQLYECDKPFIEVEKELGFISSYIELQKGRLNDNYTVICKGLDEVNGFVISPLLLMPLIENCFKHVSNYPEHMNSIAIECHAEATVFCFTTCNTADNAGDRMIDAGVPDDPHSGDKREIHRNGIGLENVRRRLELIYPGRHELITRIGQGYYEAVLQLQF
jgi:two-component system, LytTR family, sensor kinase